MSDIVLTVYTTQGIPIFEIGGTVPLDALGISYENIDSLGVWLGVRMDEYSDNAVIGLRLDRMFEAGGRENRYILLIRTSRRLLESGEFRFTEFLSRVLQKVAELKEITYGGSPGASKWEELKKYAGDLAFILMNSEENAVEVNIPVLDYLDPGLAERGDVLMLFLKLSEALPAGRRPSLYVFSKSGSSEYSGLWITGHGKDVSELREETEERIEQLKRDSKELRRIQSELSECRQRLEDIESRYEYYVRKEASGRFSSLLKTAGILVLAVVLGIGIGFLLLPMWYTPPFAHPGFQMTSVGAASLNQALGDIEKIDALYGNESSTVLRDYVLFINASQSKKEFNMSRLLQILRRDVEIHRTLLEKLESERKSVSELNSTVRDLRKRLELVNGTASELEMNTMYFVKLSPGNVTLTEEDIRILNENPGVEGWNEVLTAHCRLLVESEAQKNVEYLVALKGNMTQTNEAVAGIITLLNAIYSEAGNMEVQEASNSFEDLERNLTPLIGSVEDYISEINATVTRIKTCENAYSLIRSWDSGEFGMKFELLIEDSRAMGYIDGLIEAVQSGALLDDPFTRALYEYSRNNKGFSVEDLKNQIIAHLFENGAPKQDPVLKIEGFMGLLESIVT
ncbi:hypothetical protein E3E36_04150 [Thermococcus sp. M36]|uniref:hypothetical protein n=1 Tax=Thermococcus sp. M36 TaxID=1638261 RepID=UPI00143A08A6|nr:hypothetical protein [Thermococcus sp. M36]NJE05344.1 hypothetical protein [Thermococcus sp. M36]